ncbi:hypothetical protein LF817_09255 [Halobacillus sp. A1]|uniref:hypothetical protein n=1 Tax=Halobacillus sp. A1 TaxID=2880262 RepID=UPI0020A6C8A7|nr:hypothetical protein [Halobacillus sp. A1]MCP3031535.1 hypothetical protein [Halobacillus sp. A1]
MNEESMNKIRRALLYTALLMLSFVLSYVIAYPLEYSPLGYDVVEKKKDAVTVQHHNLLGIEKESITYTPAQDDEWYMGWVVDEIESQKVHFHLFFTSVIVSIFWGGMDYLRGKSQKKIWWFCFSTITFAGISLLSHLNGIKEITENFI